ncbi:hypothetical protein PHYBLDRAFT_153530 [Phycomyces blakesleeanus NRRL 1555(-)]|uniref:Reverse transcriptase zinc-binding domain-containing protein n=1 Tax=Phycomyces blakesleeanus (strain ATCC 8743b / DSM 1359 / FGSC 10004 / NBRC 33097 / NRRL 1555) TaxID=763407 RepID=A0A167J6J9_PHYB8|nr:hypothetical protein PHYBLDRAFT_153530 [Phycomyces blakesleeanus NRRL 1555(-)]OAD65288.1 hypothetical protein PHYBLDRAFT_153530 [Phycomyces blakesleeanus NRRL 1555(-)]|eukprot:XP_018283328.1 hypothetical protein PHYBLDRAFT_153530 [Phycomyces blakesleeanus NRRL 1555(-)]
MEQFLQHHMFPPIKLATLCLPSISGGLGVFDPIIQQSALQLRWLLPLVCSPFGQSGLVLPWLSFLLWSFSGILDPRLPLLFPDLRPLPFRHIDSVFRNIFAAIDLLPHFFDSISINHPTYLSLPLPSICLPSSLIPRTWRHLLVTDAFVVDDSLQVLCHQTRPKCPQSPRIITKFFHQVDNHSVLLQPFFFRSLLLHSLLDGLLPPPSSPIVLHVDPSPFLTSMFPIIPCKPFLPKTFHTLCTLSPDNPIPPLHTHQRCTFWSTSIHHSVCSLWFRTLHNKLLCCSVLHQTVPTIFPGGSCPICGDIKESTSHFLFTCSPKFSIWTMFWSTHFGNVPSMQDIHSALFFLCLPPSLTPDILAVSFVSCILLTIWCHYWSFMFDNAPFLSTSVLVTAASFVTSFHAKLSLPLSD